MRINNLLTPYILTAEIADSHITVGICELRTHTIVGLEQNSIRFEVYNKGSVNDILTAWQDAFEQVLKKNPAIQISGLGIAMPGPFDYESGISYIKKRNKYKALYGRDIKQYLAVLLKLDPQSVRFRNDGESTIAGEVLAGTGKGHRRVLGITLDTNFGSAYSENGITRDIKLGSEPYKKTIADDYFSAHWFLKRYYDLTGISLTGGVEELSDLAAKSSAAKMIFKEFAFAMIDFLSGPVEQLSPEVLIISGNIAKAHKFFMPDLIKGLGPLNIKLAQLGENAPLIGASAMFADLLQPAYFNSLNEF